MNNNRCALFAKSFLAGSLLFWEIVVDILSGQDSVNSKLEFANNANTICGRNLIICAC